VEAPQQELLALAAAAAVEAPQQELLALAAAAVVAAAQPRGLQTAVLLLVHTLMKKSSNLRQNSKEALCQCELAHLLDKNSKQ
jgi:hypothetical protein